MSEIEIALAQAYLSASGHDPVGALIRSVRDLAKVRRLLASRADALACTSGHRRVPPNASAADMP